MKIEITAKPIFHFSLTPEEVTVLMQMGRDHYDSHCKKMTEPGGFIYGWYNAVTYNPNSKIMCTASWRDLDTCLKIMEMWFGLSPITVKIVNRLNKAFREAMTFAQHQAKSWECAIETPYE